MVVVGATVAVVGATVVVGARVVVVAVVVVGARVVVVVVVGAAVVVVVVSGTVVVVVVGFAVHWAYNVKSAVWLCTALVVISVPLIAAVNQPANVWPSRVGSAGSALMVPPTVVVASPPDTAEPPWLS